MEVGSFGFPRVVPIHPRSTAFDAGNNDVAVSDVCGDTTTGKAKHGDSHDYPEYDGSTNVLHENMLYNYSVLVKVLRIFTV